MAPVVAQRHSIAPKTMAILAESIQSEAKNVDQGVNQIFHIQFPVEIWTAVIKEVCDPLTTDEMLAAVENHTRDSNPEFRKRDTGTLLSVALTCRTFAELALPFLFHSADTVILGPTPDFTGLSTNWSLFLTLESPIPNFLNCDARLYSDFVRFLSLGYLTGASVYEELLQNCPNVTHLVCSIGPHDFKWGPVFSQMPSLIALRISASDSLCADDDRSILIFPKLETLHLRIRHSDTWGTEFWDLPKLRRLGITYEGFVHPAKTVEFFKRHGRTVEYLDYISKMGSSILVNLESLCPRLTHLQLYHHSDLGSLEPKPVHRGVTILSFPYLRAENVMEFDEGELDLGTFRDPRQQLFQNIRRIQFPSLKQIRCLWTPMYVAPEFDPTERPMVFMPWFFEVLAEWERNGIEMIRTDTNEVLTVESLKL
ncbi:hypothetical protein SISNIDRAFT_491575 [Sistotremastrum niveocremeum HHB9708]|uniref:F-box domain-containing protein n=1 Tax=Sistotremastrum niveocremeum HHB9708 TaxID=1314777 RepID=A0A164MM23_9AGAM|nr:hypothetical protein SISNIDRAFT_491575 [Sistotremastrum niveocremeum HHB9708]